MTNSHLGRRRALSWGGAVMAFLGVTLRPSTYADPAPKHRRTAHGKMNALMAPRTGLIVLGLVAAAYGTAARRTSRGPR